MFTLLCIVCLMFTWKALLAANFSNHVRLIFFFFAEIISYIFSVSLYNVLALENTRLLHAYSELDERAKALGVVVKEWAKCCEIGDASRGSLSSYSFIVMLIHFLQRTTPPVLPFLQEAGFLCVVFFFSSLLLNIFRLRKI